MSTLLLRSQNRTRDWQQYIVWGTAFLLAVALSLTALQPLWEIWQSDSGLSQGPLLWLISLVLIWTQREKLRRWDAASPAGLALLFAMAVLYVLAVWADIAFLKPLAFIGIIAGGIWFLGGEQAIRACVGALGLLAFTVPWPTTLVSAITFPLQLMSSAYAALFAGMLGLSIHRDGVYLFVMPEVGIKPIYGMQVAAACSGLTSLAVLLALGYLIAYYTPTRWWGRLALVAAVVPLALFANAVRLTIILLVGAHSGEELAKWVHDHEQPVLISFCSLGLIGLRQALLAWAHPSLPADGTPLLGLEGEADVP